MVADWRGIIIGAAGSAADGVIAWSFDLGLEGQLEQWQGPADHSGAILAGPPPLLFTGRHQREKSRNTKRTEWPENASVHLKQSCTGLYPVSLLLSERWSAKTMYSNCFSPVYVWPCTFLWPTESQLSCGCHTTTRALCKSRDNNDPKTTREKVSALTSDYSTCCVRGLVS